MNIGKNLRANPSRRIVIQLEIGAVGYLVGAVAWSFFWLAIAQNYVGMWWGYWFYVGFFAVSLGLLMVGIGCFALGKLYGSRLPVITGVINTIAALLFFLVGFFVLPTTPSYPWRLEFVAIFGYGFLIASLFLWMTLTTSDIARSSYRRLRTAIGYTSLVSAILFLFSFLMVYWNPIVPTILTQPYVLAQVLSAMLLHKTGSDIQRKPHDSKQARA